jgi:isopenicillin-N N-acyltransferase-like protein
MLKKIIRFILWLLGIIFILFIALIFYVRIVAKADPPRPVSMESLNLKVSEPDSGLYVIGNNWFRKSESGLYELYVEGEPFERGVIIGKLTQDLVQHQEVVFNEQIRRLVPSSMYRGMLTYFIGWFNRDLDKHVTEEYRLEIFGISQSASHEFDDIASPYQRMLNYHGAHDIGHALQNMSLVGCTAFATWDGRSADSSLIIGRNFDFFVGDEFARDKIIAFYNPSEGHKFMMVTFGGMTGVLSGMNDQGLTITINAAKSEIPSGSATPVSLVAREILQYAATIDEAYAVAEKRKMFVSESFMIGSAKDGRAVILEKSPEAQYWYSGTSKNELVCTNHFQDDELGKTELNAEHIRTSASPYRLQRVQQLLSNKPKNSVAGTVSILRNHLGLNDVNIGLGNEKAVNQFVAHHGIVFQPEKLKVWISTAPWQLGKFVCYDLHEVFAAKLKENHEVYETQETIPADSFLLTPQYKDIVKFNKYRFPFNPKDDLQPDSIVKWNPDSYHSYMLAGDYLMQHKEYDRAKAMYQMGLTKEVATEQEREHMKKNLATCNDKLQ